MVSTPRTRIVTVVVLALIVLTGQSLPSSTGALWDREAIEGTRFDGAATNGSAGNAPTQTTDVSVTSTTTIENTSEMNTTVGATTTPEATTSPSNNTTTDR